MLTQHRCICEGNININLKEIRQKDTDWIYLAQDKDTWWALVNKVTKLWVPSNVGHLLPS